jgi:hypothetical protein
MIRSHFEAVAAADATLRETRRTFEAIYASSRTREQTRQQGGESMLSNSLLTLSRSCESQLQSASEQFRLISSSHEHSQRLAGADEVFVLAVCNVFQAVQDLLARLGELGTALYRVQAVELRLKCKTM